MYLLVKAQPGSPGQRVVKQLCVCVCVTLALLYTKNTEIPGRDVDWVDAIVESGKLGHIW